MAKKHMSTEDTTGSATATAEEDEEDEAQIQVDLDEVTGLPITVDAAGNFIPKIPKSFFFSELLKVDKYDARLAFLTYYRDMIGWRIDQHKAIRDPVRAKALRIEKLKAELARLTA